jgi:hypothetical protein
MHIIRLIFVIITMMMIFTARSNKYRKKRGRKSHCQFPQTSKQPPLSRSPFFLSPCSFCLYICHASSFFYFIFFCGAKTEGDKGMLKASRELVLFEGGLEGRTGATMTTTTMIMIIIMGFRTTVKVVCIIGLFGFPFPPHFFRHGVTSNDRIPLASSAIT